jgi:hypothetical protein
VRSTASPGEHLGFALLLINQFVYITFEVRWNHKHAQSRRNFVAKTNWPFSNCLDSGRYRYCSPGVSILDLRVVISDRFNYAFYSDKLDTTAVDRIWHAPRRLGNVPRFVTLWTARTKACKILLSLHDFSGAADPECRGLSLCDKPMLTHFRL